MNMTQIVSIMLQALLAVMTAADLPDTGGEEGCFTFIQISDPQIGFFENNLEIYRDSLNLETAVAQINRLKPAFVVVTGDMVNSSGSKTQKDCYRMIMDKTDKSIAVWQIPGNHDIGGNAGDEDLRKYLKDYGYERFSFRYGGWAFIGINSCIIKGGNTSREKKQYRWLEKQLRKASGADGIFVFSHYPVFVRTYDEKTGYSNLDKDARDRYWKLFRKYHVDAVIAGHLHDTAESVHDGIGMYTAGPVGKPLGHGVSGVAVWTVDPAHRTYSRRYLSLDELCDLPRL